MNQTPDAYLDVRGLTLQYQTAKTVVTAIYRVSLKVLKSDRFVLLGPSGCGKSTLLKAIGGYIPATEGAVHLRNRVVEKPGPDRMMVFQEFDQLLPWQTVRQNVLFPMRMSGKFDRKQAHEQAARHLDMVGLTRFADAYPHTLSGGMKARVAIARGMAMEPDVLLMDEPFAALDALTRGRMQEELLRLWEQTRVTILFVTHSISEAITIGNRILLMSPHPGRVIAELGSSGNDGCDDDGVLFSQRIHTLLFGAGPAEVVK